MRIAAGIILIITGIASMMVPDRVADMIAQIRAESYEEYLQLLWSLSTSLVPLGLALLALIVGGGICALMKKAWGWALLAAICSMIAMGFVWNLLAILGLLAIIFLAKRKGEFQKLAPSEHESAGK